MSELNIFIATKGRYDNCKTVQLFKEYSNYNNLRNIFLVVEPRELALYKKNYPDQQYLILPEENKGLAFARNFIKRYSEIEKMPNYWVLDDDISYFYNREGKKLNRVKFDEALIDSQRYFISNEVACGGLEYRQFAWSSKKRGIYNSFCDCVVFIDNNLTYGLYYNEKLKLKIDRDYCIKVISSGQKTCRDTMNAFSVPPNGSNKGGLKEIAYDKKNVELNACKIMVEIWGENICQHIEKKDGRNDLKIHWKNINNNQTKLF